MELRHLRYFVAVADHKSFTAAARHVHVSQSALSGQIRGLEEEIGVTLFERNNRVVCLSPGGTVFLEEARQILSHAERAREMAGGLREGKSANSQSDSADLQLHHSCQVAFASSAFTTRELR
jgi:DNA-binding transcriptional LysR family regulator